MFYPICIICVLLVSVNLSVPPGCEDLLRPSHQVISANLIGLSGKQPTASICNGWCKCLRCQQKTITEAEIYCQIHGNEYEMDNDIVNSVISIQLQFLTGASGLKNSACRPVSPSIDNPFTNCGGAASQSYATFTVKIQDIGAILWKYGMDIANSVATPANANNSSRWHQCFLFRRLADSASHVLLCVM